MNPLLIMAEPILWLLFISAFCPTSTLPNSYLLLLGLALESVLHYMAHRSHWPPLRHPMLRYRNRSLLFLLSLLLLFVLILNVAVLIERSLYNNSNENLQSSSSSSSSLVHLLEIKEKEEEEKFRRLRGSSPERGGSGLTWYKVGWSVNITANPLAKPWFMKNGTVRPSSSYVTGSYALWPEDVRLDKHSFSFSSSDPRLDRIVNQLMYFPRGYRPESYQPRGTLPLKKILLYFGKGNWGDAGLKLGQGRFLDDHCPVSSCSLVDDVEAISEVDAVIFKDRFSWPRFGRPLGQLWILFLLEGPRHTQLFSSIQENTFNWTATYRHDSDLVTPYEKFVTYESLYGGGGDEGDDEGDEDSMPENVDLFRSVMLSDDGDNNLVKPRNYAEGKTKKVAIFISNCAAQNKRLEYTRELSKHIEVDIYGNCGKLKCPRSKPEECFAMLNRDYKFYLAFENSNCRDYITEKFFVNSLGHNSDSLNIVPVVMGGSREDYRRSAPAHSFIHVDDFRSPALLARYLSYLDGNDTAYNEFFYWKNPEKGPRTGEFINTYFWCRLCALLHAPPVHRKSTVSYKSMAQWWAPKGVCLKGFSRWPE